MAFTRKMLEAMGIDEKQIESLIEAHDESIRGIKADRDKYKEIADRVPELEKQVGDLQAASVPNGEWEKKYNEEHRMFEEYKTSVADEKAAAEKVNAYRTMLVESGFDPKQVDKVILKLADMSKIEMSDGSLKDAEALRAAAEKEWPEFIVQKKTVGANTATPPNTKDGTDVADPEISKFLQERHARLYGKSTTKEG